MPPITTTAAPRSTPRAPLASSLINPLSIGPAFREVAAYLLRLQLKERYPTLDIDPDIVMVATPSWEIIDGKARDWTDEDRLMARQVTQTPDLAERALNDRFETHAYVLDVDQVDDAGKPTHLDENLVSGVIGKQEGRDVILAHSMLMGFRKYPTLNALGEDLPLLLDTAITHKTIEWRLLEPDGDFFDYLACDLVTIQIEAIGAINFSDLRSEGASQLSLAGPPGAVPLVRWSASTFAWRRTKSHDQTLYFSVGRTRRTTASTDERLRANEENAPAPIKSSPRCHGSWPLTSSHTAAETSRKTYLRTKKCRQYEAGYWKMPAAPLLVRA